jgi:hypothetical protein
VYTDEQIHFGKEELKIIMAGDKTRYKAIVENQDILQKMEHAVLVVSMAKTHAYTMAKQGLDVNVKDKDQLNAAMLILQQNMVSLSDISLQNNLGA